MYTVSLEGNVSNVVLQHAMNQSHRAWLRAAWDLSTGYSPSTARQDEEVEGWLFGLLLHENQGIRSGFGRQPNSARGN